MRSALRSLRLRFGGLLRARHRHGLGQSLVEFALVLPLMLVFLAGALDLGRVFYATITLNNAAREGALQAAQTPEKYQSGAACDPATNLVTCRVMLESKGSMVTIAPADIDMSCSMSGCPKQAGSTATVGVRGQFQLLTPLLSGVFGGQTLQLAASATAQITYLPDPSVATPPPEPVAAFTSDYPGPTEAPLTVEFTDTSTNEPTDWMWDLDGDGNVDSHDQNPTWEYTVPGTYTVTLTAINATSTDIETKTDYIEILPPGEGESPEPTSDVCVNLPNIVGKSPAQAIQDVINAGFVPAPHGTLTTGQKNVVQAQNPDHTQCRLPNTGVPIDYFYRPS